MRHAVICLMRSSEQSRRVKETFRKSNAEKIHEFYFIREQAGRRQAHALQFYFAFIQLTNPIKVLTGGLQVIGSGHLTLPDDA